MEERFFLIALYEGSFRSAIALRDQDLKVRSASALPIGRTQEAVGAGGLAVDLRVRSSIPRAGKPAPTPCAGRTTVVRSPPRCPDGWRASWGSTHCDMRVE